MPDCKDLQRSMDTIDWPYLKSLLSDEDRIEYNQLKLDPNRGHEFLITNPALDPVTARNLRVHYILSTAVAERRIQKSDIYLHDQFFHELGALRLKEQRTEEEEEKAMVLEEKLRSIWFKADPENNSHRLALEYAKRSSKASKSVATG